MRTTSCSPFLLGFVSNPVTPQDQVVRKLLTGIELGCLALDALKCPHFIARPHFSTPAQPGFLLETLPSLENLNLWGWRDMGNSPGNSLLNKLRQEVLEAAKVRVPTI